MSNNPCKICNNVRNNKLYDAKEMMFGLGGQFTYLECGKCGCLQLLKIPSNLANYYPQDYYSYTAEGEDYILDNSYKNQVKKYLKKCLTRHRNNDVNILGAILSVFIKDRFPWLKKGIVNFNSKILDVGCGAGDLLLNMRFNGFCNLAGADPFIKERIIYKCGVIIDRKSIFDIKEKFDLIMMHHSFEHMENPQNVLERINSLLNINGYVFINIPVANSFAWKKYGVNWVQLDAPRHLFLHTEKSIEILAEKTGFNLIDVVYQSTEFQFTGSELYLSGQNLNSGSLPFTKDQIKEFKNQARHLDNSKQGDTAIFYLQKMN